MKVYEYSTETKEYIGEQEAILDPLESKKLGQNIYLLPPNCTMVKPPDFE